MNTQELYTLYREHTTICTDSRAAEPGSLFFALKGDQFDGNQYAANALKGGCSYAIVDDPEVVAGEAYVLVENVLSSLQDLARFHRQQLGIPVFALTGTNGKTTTKELVYAVLKKSFEVIATAGNLNNHIGVPLTILRADDNTGILVLEMGANHVGEIAHLCSIADPTHGLVTNVGRAHLEGFGSFEGVVKAKSELLHYLMGKRATLFVNHDDNLLTDIIGAYPAIRYGQSAECDVQCEPADSVRNLNLRWHLTTSCQSLNDGKALMSVHTQLTGQYNMPNVMAAIAVGQNFGVDCRLIKEAIEAYRPTNMRSEWRETDRNAILLDAYNANPSSMKLAVSHFISLPGHNKTLILGDMFELGESADAEHIEIIEQLRESGVSDIYLAGRVFSETCNDDFKVFEKTEDLLAHLRQFPVSGRMILIKGSRGMRLETLLEAL